MVHLSDEYIQFALQQFRNNDGWKRELHSEHVTMLVHPQVPLHSGGHIRGTRFIGTVKIPISIMVRIFQEIEHWDKWDAHHNENCNRILLDNNEELVFSVSKSPNTWIFSSREFLSVRKVLTELDPKTNKNIIYIVGRVIEDSKFPVLKGNARGKMHMQVIRLEEVSDTECHVHNFACMELGGSVPTIAQNYVLKRQSEDFTKAFFLAYDYFKNKNK